MTILESIKNKEFNRASIDIKGLASTLLNGLNKPSNKNSLFLDGFEGSVLCKNVLKDTLEKELRQQIIYYLENNAIDNFRIEEFKDYLSQEEFKYTNNKANLYVTPKYLGTVMSYQRFKKHISLNYSHIVPDYYRFINEMREYSKIRQFPEYYKNILIKVSNNNPIWFTWNIDSQESDNPFSFYKDESIECDKKELFRVALGLGKDRFDRSKPIDNMLVFIFKYIDIEGKGLKNDMIIYRPTICDSSCYPFFRYNENIEEPYGCTYLINKGRIESGKPRHFHLKTTPSTKGFQEVIGESKHVRLSSLYKTFIL